ncbi:MAG: hypothetical protein R8G66_16200 [Cytophagales bacterium]|nr:hypothetical protein [Cytophagales bacterium]
MSAQEVSPSTKIFQEDTIRDGIMRVYHEDGKSLWFKGRMKAGMRKGPWIYYRKDGTVNTIVQYDNDTISGPTLYYDEQEIKVSETMFVNGIKEGHHNEFYNDGSVALSGFFSNGLKDSTWTEHLGYQRKGFEENYSKGKLHGKSVYYYDQEYSYDRIQAIENYRYGVKHGEWRFYYFNRQLEKSFTYENGLLQGVYNEYYRNGKKKEEGNFSYDQREGKWLTFHEEGELATIGRYFRDQKSGLWKYFSATGTLRSEGRYKNDLRDGQWIYYYEDGTLSAVGSYRLGEKDGLWGLFYTNDQLQQEQTWKNGSLMETSEFYSIKGEALEAGTLKEGSGTYFEYYPEGELYISANLVDGLFHGEYTIYYSTGNRQAQGQMAYGLQEGEWTYWHTNDKPESNGSFSQGEKVGYWNYYNGRGKLREKINHDE